MTEGGIIITKKYLALPEENRIAIGTINYTIKSRFKNKGNSLYEVIKQAIKGKKSA